MRKPTVSVDMDGVLLKYDGFKGKDVFGEVIPGAIDFVANLAAGFKVVVCPARLDRKFYASDDAQIESRVMIFNYLKKLGFDIDDVQPKIAAVAYINDRADRRVKECAKELEAFIAEITPPERTEDVKYRGVSPPEHQERSKQPWPPERGEGVRGHSDLRRCEDCDEMPDDGTCDKGGDSILTTKDSFVAKRGEGVKPC